MLYPFGSTRNDSAYINLFETMLSNPSVLSAYAERGIEVLEDAAELEGAYAIDGGAAQGLHVITLALRVGPKGKVFAYEPLPNHIEFIKTRALPEHLAPRGLDKIIDLRECAIGNQNGPVEFVHVVENPGLSGLRSAASGLTKVTLQTQCVRLDDDISRNDQKRIKFIKLDLEGGEYHALQGARELLAASRPLIAMEFGRSFSARNYGFSRDDFFSFFREFQYDVVCNLGIQFKEDDWDRTGGTISNDFFVLPAERSSEILEKAWPNLVTLLQELGSR